MSKVIPGYEIGSWQKTVDKLRAHFGLKKGVEKDIALEPCRHCNGISKMKKKRFEGFGIRYYVQCEECGIMTQACLTEEAAAEIWNRKVIHIGIDLASRPDQTEIKTVIEEAK